MHKSFKTREKEYKQQSQAISAFRKEEVSANLKEEIESFQIRNGIGSGPDDAESVSSIESPEKATQPKQGSVMALVSSYFAPDRPTSVQSNSSHQHKSFSDRVNEEIQEMQMMGIKPPLDGARASSSTAFYDFNHNPNIPPPSSASRLPDSYRSRSRDLSPNSARSYYMPNSARSAPNSARSGYTSSLARTPRSGSSTARGYMTRPIAPAQEEILLSVAKAIAASDLNLSSSSYQSHPSAANTIPITSARSRPQSAQSVRSNASNSSNNNRHLRPDPSSFDTLSQTKHHQRLALDMSGIQNSSIYAPVEQLASRDPYPAYMIDNVSRSRSSSAISLSARYNSESRNSFVSSSSGNGSTSHRSRSTPRPAAESISLLDPILFPRGDSSNIQAPQSIPNHPEFVRYFRKTKTFDNPSDDKKMLDEELAQDVWNYKLQQRWEKEQIEKAKITVRHEQIVEKFRAKVEANFIQAVERGEPHALAKYTSQLIRDSSSPSFDHRDSSFMSAASSQGLSSPPRCNNNSSSVNKRPSSAGSSRDVGKGKPTPRDVIREEKAAVLQQRLATIQAFNQNLAAAQNNASPASARKPVISGSASKPAPQPVDEFVGSINDEISRFESRLKKVEENRPPKRGYGIVRK